MCGRFNFTDDQLEEIKGIIKEVNERLYGKPIKTGDVYPTDIAAVIMRENEETEAQPMIWGFPHFKNNGVIINARAETALEKPMFMSSLINRRCIIPSSGFYEWKREQGKKTKYLFNVPSTPYLYMAGAYNTFKASDGTEQNRFIILTTAANGSMKEVHDRMPVIIRPDEFDIWFDGNFVSLLNREQVLLDKASA